LISINDPFLFEISKSKLFNHGLGNFIYTLTLGYKIIGFHFFNNLFNHYLNHILRAY